MDIRTALDQLVIIQATVNITDPITETINKAWKYFAPPEAIIPELPAFMNTYTLTDEDRAHTLRLQRYTIHSQLFVEDADRERAADIATAYLGSLIKLLDAAIDLNGSVSSQHLRGGNPTLVVLDRAGKSYMGLDLFLDVEMKEAKAFST